MADQTRVDYEALSTAATQFERESDHMRRTSQQIKQAVEATQGNWVGRGAKEFQREMESSVLPSLHRLEQALAEGGRTLHTLSQMFQQADEEAAGIVKMNGDGDSGDSGDSASGDGSASGDANAMGNDHIARVPMADGADVPDETKAEWYKLTDEQKKQALQNMSDEQMKQWGGKPVKIEYGGTNPGETGYFDPKTNTLHVDPKALKDPSDAINTVEHETRHAFQRQMADRLPDQEPSWWEKNVSRRLGTAQAPDLPAGVSEDDARAWKKNFAPGGYIPAPSGSRPDPDTPQGRAYQRDYSKYWNQPVEKDAHITGDRYTQGMTPDKLKTYVPPAKAAGAP